MSKYTYQFVVTGPLEVEETFNGNPIPTGRKILKGLFLRLGHATANGREYQVEEGEQIAAELMGMPVYFDAKFIFDPLTKKMGWKHIRDAASRVGRVVKTAFKKIKNVITGWVEIMNTEKFPNLLSKIKKGFGFSIGGEVKKFINTGKINELGNEEKKAIGMKPNHLQLLPPSVPRGQLEAQVEDIMPVEESVMFLPCPWGLCPVSKVESEPKIIERVVRIPIYLTDPDSEILL